MITPLMKVFIPLFSFEGRLLKFTTFLKHKDWSVSLNYSMNKPMFCYFMRNMRILIDKALKLFHVWSCINITASQVICTTLKMYKHTYLHMCKHNQRSKNTEYAIRSVWQVDTNDYIHIIQHLRSNMLTQTQ